MNSNNNRVETVQNAIAEDDLDALVVTNPANIAYISGFRANPMERLIALVVRPDGALRLILPALEEDAARAVTPAATILFPWADADGPRSAAKGALGEIANGARVGIERDHMTVAYHDLVASLAPDAALVDGGSTLVRLRAIKQPDELEHMRSAARIVDEVLGQLVASELRPGRTEAELSDELARLSREAGADAIAGDPQVVAGARSAMPHGHSGPNRLQEGDLVIVDLGVASAGYFADISRTYVLGEAEQRQRDLFTVVHEAQQAGIEAATSGARASDVDMAARRVIQDAGLGDYFIHRTGHGLGLEIHEPPSLSSTNDEPLADGMTLTVEPGVYVPGYGGVRIEDDIVVRAGRPEVLTKAPIALEVVVRA